MADTLADLIERLERATEGSLDLDAACLRSRASVDGGQR